MQSSTKWKRNVRWRSSSDGGEVHLFLVHGFTCRTQPVILPSVCQRKWYVKVECHVRCLSSPWTRRGIWESSSSCWLAYSGPSACRPPVTWKTRKERKMRKCPPLFYLINFFYFYFWLDFDFLTCFLTSCLFSSLFRQHSSALSPDPWLCDFLYAVFWFHVAFTFSSPSLPFISGSFPVVARSVRSLSP